MSQFKQDQQFLQDSLNHNTLKSDKIFTRVRLKFDFPRDFNDVLQNVFRGAFKGFWVVDSSNDIFELEMKPNYRQSYGDSIPLKSNMSVDFDELVDGAVFSWPEQAGKWVDVIFFHKGNANIGNLEFNSLEIARASDYNHGKYSISEAVLLVVAANSSRSKIVLTNNSSVDIYFGKQTELSDANYKDICRYIGPGQTLEWRNTSGLYMRTESGTTDKVKFFEETF